MYLACTPIRALVLVVSILIIVQFGMVPQALKLLLAHEQCQAELTALRALPPPPPCPDPTPIIFERDRLARDLRERTEQLNVAKARLKLVQGPGAGVASSQRALALRREMHARLSESPSSERKCVLADVKPATR